MSLLSATPREKLFSLINTNNISLPSPLSKDSLYFGKPKLSNTDNKTILPCVAVLDGGYTGYITFDYQRINLTAAFGDKIPAISNVGATTLHDMLPVINKVFGLDLTTEDVVDINISAVSAGSQANIQVTATMYSLGYTGQFIFQFTRLRPQLSVVVAEVTLDTLTHFKSIADGKKSLEMQMFDFDFTPYKDLFVLDGGRWRYYSRLQQLMLDFGFSSWPQADPGALASYNSSAVTYANPKYDRVIIQPNVSIDGFVGRGMFHYNNVLA